LSVSVVIPTHDRAERLRSLLGSIEGADEVVVAADRPSEAVLRVLEDFDVRIVRASGGPAVARNAGWRAARGELIAFVDDDCVAAAGWLAALRGAADGAAVVQGRVAPLPAEEGRLGPFSRTLRVEGAGPFFQTANILYPRALLERLGGFDEAYAYPAGEDTDLGWRAREAGAEVRFAPDALVWHAVHELGPVAMARDAARWGSAVRIVKRHPGLRAHFHRRIWWKRSHERLVLGALAVVLLRRPWALAALAPWALEHRTGVRSLPGHLLVDAAEVAAMARGSASARTLLI
jgi:GT2 family glycosyltransferase